jgi:hypothetical protein
VILKIDRMEIDDVGANPKRLAESIIKQLPDSITAIPVREIAKAIDIYEIREALLEGLEGALVVPEDKSFGAITVRSDRSEPKKRFTIAHEIGHYVNPTHRASSPDGFRCSLSDMMVSKANPNDRHQKMEFEANRFAAELLMPEGRVKAFLRLRASVDLEHILDLAKHFQVSKEASARKYLNQLDEPAAIVFSCQGKIRYVLTKEGFPRLSLGKGDMISEYCISATSNEEQGKVTDIAETPGQLWLERSANFSLGEQTVRQMNGFRMTLLTVEETGEDDSDWAPPSFGRRG